MIPQPSIVPISDHGLEAYELEKDYTYRWHADGQEWLITLKCGFLSDGASAPRWVWTLTGISPDGLHRAAAWVHDWIYRHGGRLPHGSFCCWNVGPEWVPVPHEWTREQADKLFANMLDASGVSKARRRWMYRAVRLFGRWSWRGPN